MLYFSNNKLDEMLHRFYFFSYCMDISTYRYEPAEKTAQWSGENLYISEFAA